MKRLVIAALVLALVGAFAFADGATAKWAISTNYGFGFVSANSTNTLGPFDWSQEGTGRTRLGFTYTAADGNAGFNSRLQMGVPPMAASFNQLNAWAKLFGGVLTVRAGLLDDYTISTQDWNCYGNTDGKFGVFFDVAPVAGLDIGFFQIVSPLGPVASDVAFDGDIIGAKYAIKDVGDLSAGVVLNSIIGTTIYAGFQFKGVTGLTAILESSVLMGKLIAGTFIAADENLGYTMGALTFGARIGELYDTVSAKFNWGIEPSVAFKANDNLTINAIANVYSQDTNDALVWSSGAIYSGVVSGVVAADTIGFGAGANISWAASGFTVTVGDYFSAAAAPAGGNIVYVNADISL